MAHTEGMEGREPGRQNGEDEDADLPEGLQPLLEARGQHEVAAPGQRRQLLPHVGVAAQGLHVHRPAGPGPGTARELDGPERHAGRGQRTLRAEHGGSSAPP